MLTASKGAVLGVILTIPLSLLTVAASMGFLSAVQANPQQAPAALAANFRADSAMINIQLDPNPEIPEEATTLELGETPVTEVEVPVPSDPIPSTPDQDETPVDSTLDSFSAVAGRVTTLDLGELQVAEVKILSTPDHGTVTVNPDHSLALVLTRSDDTTDLNFDVLITYEDGSTQTKAVAIDVTEGSQQGGWGLGDAYMLETNTQDKVVVEHGESHRKVYVSGGEDALTIKDIAALEGLSVDQIKRSFFADHPEYGATPEMALAEDAADYLWIEVSGEQAGPTSNWLLFDRGYTYDSMRINPNVLTGESELHPVYVGAYGTGDAPIIDIEIRVIASGTENVVFQDVHLTEGFRAVKGENLLFDNVTVTGTNIDIQNVDSFTLRNSSIHDVVLEEPAKGEDTWSPHLNRTSGIFVKSSTGVLLENSLYDHNGWADDYREDLSGTGGQPPSKYSHNIYLQSDNLDVTLRDNIIMRGSASGAQVRSGGFIEDNIFLDNNGGGMFGSGGKNPATGNYTLFTDNVISSGAHKMTDDGTSALTAGFSSQGNLATLVDNIITHLADPDNPAEKAWKETTNWALGTKYEVAPAVDDTIIYNWEGANAKEGLNDQNLDGLDTKVLDQTTIQNFAADLLGKDTATIADLADYLRAQANGAFDGVVDADLIIAFFQKGFGLDTDLRGEAETLRFVPNELGDGVRWDNRLNWDSGDLPGTQNGDQVELGGNWVQYSGTTQLKSLDFGSGGILDVSQGYLAVTGLVSVGKGNATLDIDAAGQVWFDGYSDNNILKINAEGGRFANTGLSTGNIRLTSSDNAQVILATDGAEYIMGHRSKITIKGGESHVGFDGDAGGTAVLLMSGNAKLSFVAADGLIGTIGEFYSGRFDEAGSGVRSGVNLGDVTLDIDVADIAALGRNKYDLIHVDELIGSFGNVNVTGLASDQNAKVLVDYSTDKVTLLIGNVGSGDGTITVQTVGVEADAKADLALFTVLSDGHGIYGGETTPPLVPGSDEAMIGSSDNDVLRGTSEDNYIAGFDGTDILRGFRGKDSIFGGHGDDVLKGGRSRDQLFGSEGKDVIAGGRGRDTLTGGDDEDIFYFGQNHGSDRITDFTAGEDIIHLNFTGASFESLVINAHRAGTLIDTGRGTIMLLGVDETSLTADDFLF